MFNNDREGQSLELIGCSLDDFSDYLIFIDNKGFHYYLALHRYVDLGGWGDIRWEKREQNLLDYYSVDESLNEYEWCFKYIPENDTLEVSGGKEFPDFDTVDDFVTLGMKEIKIDVITSKIQLITDDFFINPIVPSLEKTKKYFNL